MPLISLRNYVAVAPCGTLAAESLCGRPTYGWSQADAHVAQADERVLAAIGTAQNAYNISAARVFIAGFDGGGTMALRLACNNPQLFAGVLSLCGQFPSGRAPLGRLAEVRRLPVFLATGRTSGDYPPAKVCENLRLFYAAGMSISLREYPCGHELTTQMLADVDRWLMEQITAPATASPNPSGQNAREA
jgi:phospholipase/carboxylesterase